jgi:hypothetical protein
VAGKEREKMKNLRWIAVLGILAFCSAYALADGVPPDGAVGTARGGKSTPITSLNTTFTFSPCAGATGDVAFDCALFGGGAQEVFAGINETGFAWNSLSIGLTGLTPTDLTVGCNGGANNDSSPPIFGSTNCPITIPDSGSVVVTFLQGPNGTGIGCYNAALPTNAPTNVACVANSIIAFGKNKIFGTSDPYDTLGLINPSLPTGCPVPPFYPPGAVCGSSEFVIGVGIDSLPFNPEFLPAGGTLIANSPEPQTILLVGGAMISMLMLGLKKARLV